MLQFISHYNSRFSYLEGIALALEGGCRWIQLRMKEASDEEFLACAKEAGPLCRSYGARFIIDDRVRLLEDCGADGVHLGRNDMPVAAGPGRDYRRHGEHYRRHSPSRRTGRRLHRLRPLPFHDDESEALTSPGT